MIQIDNYCYHKIRLCLGALSSTELSLAQEVPELTKCILELARKKRNITEEQMTEV